MIIFREDDFVTAQNFYDGVLKNVRRNALSLNWNEEWRRSDAVWDSLTAPLRTKAGYAALAVAYCSGFSSNLVSHSSEQK